MLNINSIVLKDFLLFFSLLAIVRDEEVMKQFEENFEKVMPGFLQLDGSIEKDRVNAMMAQVRDYYFGPGERIDTKDKMENYTNVMTGKAIEKNRNTNRICL